MGTRGYAAFKQHGADTVMAVAFREDSDPAFLGEGMAAVARRRASFPAEPLSVSLDEGLRGFLEDSGQSTAGADGVPARNFLQDLVYCEYLYIVDLDEGRFEAWWGYGEWYETDTEAARAFPDVAARHPERCLLGVFPLDVPEDWVAITGWPGRYRKD